MTGSPVGASANGGQLLAGITLAVFASMSGTAGKQALRFSELQRRKATPASICVGKVAFAIGLGLNTIIGPLIDMGSYAFAPQSVIAPLGGLDIVWNTLTAPFTLGETLTLRLFCGCVVILAGATVTSLAGSHDSGEFSADTIKAILIRPAVLFYLLALGAWLLFNILVLMPRSAAPKGQPWTPGDRLRGLSLGMTAGSIAGNMFCVKAFVEVVQASIQARDGQAWVDWLPYGLFAAALFFAFANLYFLTKAMREYEALFMGAVFEGSLIIAACISGVVIFSELKSLQAYQVALYWAAILCIVGGICIVCSESGPAPVKEGSKDTNEQTDGPAEGQAEEGDVKTAPLDVSDVVVGCKAKPAAADDAPARAVTEVTDAGRHSVHCCPCGSRGGRVEDGLAFDGVVGTLP
uniref:Uncharacterized protein n=1 Tax=Alexandrium catenella TaxID=2925 RepID=A0A7S1RFG2_ALECA|mmetsp:Transcript_55275/g.148048  ORF Transcript_55275/g.148048 Transcript_55275/m.148048 type:complete len:408 (+) Transcript_55275:108-1331(+)